MVRYPLALLFVGSVACRADIAAPQNPQEAALAAPAEVPEAIASEVLGNMDPSASPCDDFYQFACGGWLESTPLPADEPRFGRFHRLAQQNQERLREILEAQTTQGQLGQFYTGCMDEAAVDAAGIKPLEPVFRQIETIESPDDAMGVVGRLHRIGAKALMSAQVQADYKDSRVNVAHLSQGGLGLPDRDYYLASGPRFEQIRAGYAAHVAKMFELLGNKDPAQTAHKVIAFERGLAEISLPRAELRDPEKLYNRTDLAGLKKLGPQVAWERFFAGIGQPSANALNVAPQGFFTGVAELVVSTKLEVVRDYLRWQLVHAMAPELSGPFVAAHFEFFDKTLRGQQKMAPRWKRCVKAADKALGHQLSRHFVEQAFAGESRQVAISMIEQVEQAFADGLPRLAWMDATTQQRALEKMHAVVNKIGYPDKWRDDTGLTISGGHIENVMNAATFEFDRHASKIGGDVDRSQWYMTPATVNAYYNPSNNEMVFPAGILQPPFFHPDYPMSMNFGGIGMVMGHELTHGFDDQGRKFDGMGQLSQWWGADASGRFEQRAACVDDLYSSFEVQPGLKLNGKLTLGENIADLGGIKQAFRAYHHWAEQEGVDPNSVAAGNLSHEQLFFVAYGQLWCTKASPQFERVAVATDSHSHPRYRVNGPLSNLPEFWDTFACDEGEQMRPANVCEVW